MSTSTTADFRFAQHFHRKSGVLEAFGPVEELDKREGELIWLKGRHGGPDIQRRLVRRTATFPAGHGEWEGELCAYGTVEEVEKATE